MFGSTLVFPMFSLPACFFFADVELWSWTGTGRQRLVYAMADADGDGHSGDGDGVEGAEFVKR
jgi:hypothetical protein